MKKLLAILLVCVFAFSVVACGGGEEESSAAGFTNSGATSSKADESSEAADESSEAADESSEAAGESSEVVEAATVTQFISWKNAYYAGGIVGVRVTDTTSLALNKLDEDVEAGENAVFTRAYGATIECEGQDYADFAIAVFEYDHSVWGYVKTSFAAVGEGDAATAIPEDGWVTVINKDATDKIAAIEALTATDCVYPHGFVVNSGLDATISAAETAPAIDGSVSAAEYGDVIWEINPENELFSYAQFVDQTNINATAKVYMTYDETYFYIGIVVDTPDHFNNLTPDNCGDMYNYTCIQANFASEVAGGEYMMSGNWDQSGGKTDAANTNIVRQHGFGVNAETGETLKCVWFAASGTDESVVCNTREGQITTYEIAIPWTDLGATGATIVPEVGTEFGFGLSVNSGTETAQFQNITMRDGGGIIGINDWSKIPTITLG